MRYELGNKGKPIPSKEQIISMVEASRQGLATKPQTLVAAACLFQRPPTDRPDVPWARTVIDYASAERVFDKMVQDDLLVGRLAHEWAKMGISKYLQGRTMYYATNSTSRDIHDVYNQDVRGKYMRKVRQIALEKLADLHPEEFASLMKETEENLPDPL